MSSRTTEFCLVAGLYLINLLLWIIKRKQVIRAAGIDPEVLAKATTPQQKYFAKLVAFLTIAVVVLIAAHTFAPWDWAVLTRVAALDHLLVDILGAALGLLGLGLCLVAQLTMGSSWRVGIDKEHQTTLITHGVYRLIRNPTYVGLFSLNLGVWFIWPSPAMAFYWLLFFVAIEIQVRCEEEHMENLHGDTFTAYAARTRRYIPWIY
jgi:protein-S-isoprenylcysteine O-methyltransferase Ste14